MTSSTALSTPATETVPSALPRVSPIPKRDTDTLAAGEFHERFVRPARPLVLRGGMGRWRALERWSDPTYLRDAFGELEVPIVVKPRSAPTGDRAPVQPMALRAFFDEVFAGNGHRHLYLLEQPIYAWSRPGLLGAVAQDVEIPALFPRASHLTTGMFAGRDTRSVCHYHPAGEVILCQVVGRKRVRLFPPDGAAFHDLYPQAWHSMAFSFSRVEFPRDGSWPDLWRYPRLARTRPFECVLEPGDMLYIPIYWWHVAFGQGISISAAHWWMSSFQKRYLSRLGLRSNYLNQRLLRRHLSMESLRNWAGIVRARMRGG